MRTCSWTARSRPTSSRGERFTALARPLPDGADEALTALRKDWHLLTLEEDLAQERQRSPCTPRP